MTKDITEDKKYKMTYRYDDNNTSMFVSIESGFIFSLITTKSNLIYSSFCNIFNIKQLYRNYILMLH